MVGDSSSTDGGGGESSGGDAGAGASGDFCQFAVSASDRFDESDFEDPGAFEATYREVISDYESAARFAPDAIRDDVALLLDSAGDFMEAMDESDRDFAALADDDPRIINPEADAAGDRLDEFCGID